VLVDVDITELQVQLDDEDAISDALTVYERVTEVEREGHDAQSNTKRRMQIERRRLQLVASARRHRNRKKVNFSIARLSHGNG
jgi:uncharacterized membrane protein YccC